NGRACRDPDRVLVEEETPHVRTPFPAAGPSSTTCPLLLGPTRAEQPADGPAVAAGPSLHRRPVDRGRRRRHLHALPGRLLPVRRPRGNVRLALVQPGARP